MAITWEVTIGVTDLAQRRVLVRAVRTDDAAPESPWSHVQKAQVPPGANAQQIANVIVSNAWAAWQAEQTKAAQIEAFLGIAESLAKTGLEAQEGS